MIQQLVDSKFTPNEVAQLSGLKNLKNLDSYMTTSKETQKKMSLTLSKGTTAQVEKSIKETPLNQATSNGNNHIATPS